MNTREPLRFSWRHWWNLVMVALLAGGVALWRLRLIDGRLVLAAVIVWLVAGWLLMPSILLEHLGFLDRNVFHDYSKARVRYRRAVDTKKATPEAYSALASLSLAEGDTAEADALLKEAVANRPDDPYLHALHSQVLSRLGRHEEAVMAAMRCLGARGARSLGDSVLAEALRAKGEVVGAASAYQKLALADPRSPAPRVGLASAYLSLGDVDAASREAAEAVRLSPKDPDALYWAGRVSEAKGDKASARRLYQSALEMRPIGDKSLSVPYQEMVRAVSSTSPKDASSLGKDIR